MDDRIPHRLCLGGFQATRATFGHIGGVKLDPRDDACGADWRDCPCRSYPAAIANQRISVGAQIWQENMASISVWRLGRTLPSAVPQANISARVVRRRNSDNVVSYMGKDREDSVRLITRPCLSRDA